MIAAVAMVLDMTYEHVARPSHLLARRLSLIAMSAIPVRRKETSRRAICTGEEMIQVF
jgi:hypothetical protein